MNNQSRNGELRILIKRLLFLLKNGHIEIVKLCKKYGATDFNAAIFNASYRDHIEIVKLLKEWKIKVS